MTVSSDGLTSTIFLNGKTYTLPKKTDETASYEWIGNTGYAYLVPLETSNPNAWIYWFAEDTDGNSLGSGYENFGGFIVGFETDPATVSAQTGTASLTGIALGEYYVGSLREAGRGSFVANVDFDKGVVDGTLALSDLKPSNGIRLPEITLTFNAEGNPNIAGNAFSSPKSDIQIEIESVVGEVTTVDDMALSGKIYGPTSDTVAGSFWVEGMSNDHPMFIQGTFVTD